VKRGVRPIAKTTMNELFL